MKIDYFSKGGCGCCEVNETSCGCECIRSSTSSPLLSPIPTSVFFKLLNIPLSRACFPFPPPLSLSLYPSPLSPLPSPPRNKTQILASPAAMQIRQLEALQNMARAANSKVVFGEFLLPSLSLPPPSFSSFLPPPPPPPFPNPQSQ